MARRFFIFVAPLAAFGVVIILGFGPTAARAAGPVGSAVTLLK